MLEKLSRIGLQTDIENITNYILEKCESDLCFEQLLKCMSKMFGVPKKNEVLVPLFVLLLFLKEEESGENEA